MRKVLIFLCFSAGGVLLQILMEGIFEYITGYKSNFPSCILGIVGYVTWYLILQIYDKIVNNQSKELLNTYCNCYVTHYWWCKKGEQNNRDYTPIDNFLLYLEDKEGNLEIGDEVTFGDTINSVRKLKDGEIKIGMVETSKMNRKDNVLVIRIYKNFIQNFKKQSF